MTPRARQRIRCPRNAEGAAAAAAAEGAHRRTARRRVDPALRAPLLAGTRPRAADRGGYAGLRGAVAHRADDRPVGCDAVPHCCVCPGDRARVAGASRPGSSPPCVRDRRLRLPARSGARACVRAAGPRVAGALRVRRPRSRARASSFPRCARARAATRGCGLRARARLALRAGDRLLRDAGDARRAVAWTGRRGGAHRRVHRRPRHLAAPLHRARVALLRPGGARRRLGPPREEEARCRSTSCCRRSPFRASRP